MAKIDIDDARDPARFDRVNWTANNGEIDHMVDKVAFMREALQKNDRARRGYARPLRPDHGQARRQRTGAIQAWSGWRSRCPPENIDAMRDVRQSTQTPICCGENIYLRHGFRELLEKHAVDIIMPDIQKCGGLLEARKIADMAHTYYVPMAPHCLASPIGTMAACHVWRRFPISWSWSGTGGIRPSASARWKQFVKEGDIIQKGYITVTDRPGIGVDDERRSNEEDGAAGKHVVHGMTGCSRVNRMEVLMTRIRMRLTPLFLAMIVAPCISGQIISLSKEQMIKYTAQNPFERFPDGRPKVPDGLLEKLKDMSAEDVLGLNARGYRNQWEAGWQVLHPNKILVGRAVTLQMMPMRPDISGIDQADRRAKNQTALNHQTAIDMLQKGDVLVMDACGAQFGGVIGDNLAYYIMKKTGTGFVIDGAIRDIRGIAPFDMAGYYRSAGPSAIHDLMVTGINVPVHVGGATVMPGDVVFGDPEGVYFIPPSQLQDLVDEADITHLHDDWTKKKFDEGKYVSTDIYSRPRDAALVKEYEAYLKEKLGAQKYDEYLKRRQAGRGPAAQPQR